MEILTGRVLQKRQPVVFHGRGAPTHGTGALQRQGWVLDFGSIFCARRQCVFSLGRRPSRRHVEFKSHHLRQREGFPNTFPRNKPVADHVVPRRVVEPPRAVPPLRGVQLQVQRVRHAKQRVVVVASVHEGGAQVDLIPIKESVSLDSTGVLYWAMYGQTVTIVGKTAHLCCM